MGKESRQVKYYLSTSGEKVRLLNLGCGTKVSSSPEVINIDWSIYLRIKRNKLLHTIVPFFVKGHRKDYLNSIPNNIMVYDLSKGIPFQSNSIDAVYHSHLLEHFDLDVAKKFLIEVNRVLKEGGIQRIVVPDFEKICRHYISHIAVCEDNPNEAGNHNSILGSVIEQSVRREPFGTSKQKPFRRLLENLLLGDARKRGETHQWMYDRINLCELLLSLGFKNPQIHKYNTSLIPSWNEYALDLDELGSEYKPDSLYIETTK
jgi:SAM-dependent methyltransferase